MTLLKKIDLQQISVKIQTCGLRWLNT